MKYITKLFLALFLVSSALHAKEMGTLSIFVMLDGAALEKNEVTIDGSQTYYTDKDGYLLVDLEIGEHQVEVYGKDNAGQNLGYTKKQVSIKDERDTEVIVEFESNNNIPIVSIDTPVGTLQTTDALAKATGKGFLEGSVKTSDKDLPISNARIFVKGTSIDARTDDEGKFRVEVPSDVNISISVVHSEYSSQTLNNLVVKKDSVMNTDIHLTPAAMELEEFIVLAPKVKGSIASIMAEEKESSAITNILGSEEMSKKGDSDAASALKRVTGVTLIGGRNIYVRGLGDRYSNIEMNSMPLPSPNPTKRVVPLDIFPSGVISSMKVQKSATADIPASFGGGYVDIRTKDKADKDYFKISLGAKGNSNTGKDVHTYKGSGSDWLGFDDGYRKINSDILSNAEVKIGEKPVAFTLDNFTGEELSQFSQDYVNRNYNVTGTKLPIGFNGSIEGALNFEVADDHKITLFGNYKYENENKYREETYNKYSMNKEKGELYTKPIQYGKKYNTVNEYKQSAIFNIGYNYLDVFKIKYTKLYTHNAEKLTRIVDGILGSNDEDTTRYYLDWEERTLDVDQVSGFFDYAIFDYDNTFKFGAERALANLYQPNNFKYTYLNEGEPYINNKVTNHIANNLESEDELYAFNFSNKIMLDLFSEDDFLDVGFTMSSKTRESRQNKFYLRKLGTSSVPDSDMTGTIEEVYDTYVRPDIDYDDRSLIVNPIFKPADYFDAEVDETNLYLATFMKPLESVEVLLGARQVDFSQVVYQYKEDRTNPDFSQRGKIQLFPEELTLNKLYPSMSLKYKIDKDNHIDFAYSETYIVPDLREFTSGEYFHPYDVATVLGNPDLENTDIASYDLKYSHYFSDTENIKLGLFYKYLDKPIEDVMVPSTSLPIYSFDNADNAELYGFEVDGRKSFNMIDAMFENYYIGGNFSFTDSDVTLREEQLDTYSSNHRQLQGLSQIVVNLSLEYDTKGRSVVLSYNKMGERIRKVGMIDDGDKFPDYYEVPPQLLDLVWIEKFDNGLSFKLKLGNLIDEETIWYQGSTSNITNKFKKGRDYSVSMSYKY